MPYNIDGSESAHARRVKQWIHRAKNHLSVPILTHDERLSSSEARIGFTDYSYQGDIDAESARLILEDYISSITQ